MNRTRGISRRRRPYQQTVWTFADCPSTLVAFITAMPCNALTSIGTFSLRQVKPGGVSMTASASQVLRRNEYRRRTKSALERTLTATTWRVEVHAARRTPQPCSLCGVSIVEHIVAHPGKSQVLRKNVWTPRHLSAPRLRGRRINATVVSRSVAAHAARRNLVRCAAHGITFELAERAGEFETNCRTQLQRACSNA